MRAALDVADDVDGIPQQMAVLRETPIRDTMGGAIPGVVDATSGGLGDSLDPQSRGKRPFITRRGPCA